MILCLWIWAPNIMDIRQMSPVLFRRTENSLESNGLFMILFIKRKKQGSQLQKSATRLVRLTRQPDKLLIALGIAENEAEAARYFPHGTSHYLGLDVHDPGLGGIFQPNMVITVEPGIYIPEGSECDPKWHGIAVRIEDDILITEDGPVNLSAEAPRQAEEIEKLMQESSPLNDLHLPKLY